MNFSVHLRSWKKALVYDPCFVDAHVNLGGIREQDRSLHSAKTRYNCAQKIEPTDIMFRQIC